MFFKDWILFCYRVYYNLFIFYCIYVFCFFLFYCVLNIIVYNCWYIFGCFYGNFRGKKGVNIGEVFEICCKIVERLIFILGFLIEWGIFLKFFCVLFFFFFGFFRRGLCCVCFVFLYLGLNKENFYVGDY